MSINTEAIKSFCAKAWDESIIPALKEYISIPNQSPSFDPKWASNGHMDKAVKLMVDWVKQHNVPGLKLEVVALPNRTPVIFMEVEPTKKDNFKTILLYGHLDKQPPLTEGWEQGLGPYSPVIKDGKLYGRGGADDGYAIFAAVTSIRALKEQNIPHDRYVIIIEASEESGSPDLPFYMDELKERIKTPSLIVCLDSGCGNYDQFWMTSSLRGLITGVLRVDILKEGVHSGHGSGIAPSSFRIARQLLSRIENEKDGKVINDFHVKIPENRIAQSKYQAEVLGHIIVDELPWVDGAHAVSDDLLEILLNRSWRPALSITGAEGLPTIQAAGNVMRPYTSLRLSLRIPPNVSPSELAAKLKSILEKDPPYGARVSFVADKMSAGWESPPLPDWLEKNVQEASKLFFEGKPHCYCGEGGSIPFMHMLGQRYPETQFVITGLLGPASNAHGPNEFLHIDFAKRLNGAVAHILATHAAR